MTVKPCTLEYMLSTVQGMGMAKSWFPRPVAQVTLQSTKDGPIKQSPDPVTMIDGELPWLNNSRDRQFAFMQVRRAPRSIVAQSPSTVVIHEAISKAVGESPTAEYPSVTLDTFGGRLQINRRSAAAADLSFGRQFMDEDASQSWVTIGEVAPMESVHFRYLAAVQTPGVFTTPTEFEPKWEARALWARLILWAGPVVGV